MDSFERGYWTGLAYFLAKERNRHLKDIANIEKDLDKLRSLGIDIPNPDAKEFIEVPEEVKS